MRICLITTFFPPLHFGGDGIFVANLANSLARAGHQVHVIHCADSFWLTRGTVEPSPVSIHPGIVVHTLSSSLGAFSPLLTQATGEPWLKRTKIAKILALGFDVIHWHNLSLIGGPGALDLGTGVKLCTLHDYWFICPTHILFKNNEAACLTRECFQCQLHYRRPPQLWRYRDSIKHGIQHVDRFIAPSHFVQEQFCKDPLSIRATLLPHFLPGPLLPCPDKTSDSGYFLFCGRLEKAKGLQTILPVFRKTQHRLLIAGAGSYEATLRALAAGSPNIEFLGRVPYDQLACLYRSARATIVPSVCYETFGLVILESLKEMTPVITSSFGALPEVVQETGGGVMYQNLEEFEILLDKFAQSGEAARAMGRIGYSNLSRYSDEEHLRKYFSIIDSVKTRSEQM